MPTGSSAHKGRREDTETWLRSGLTVEEFYELADYNRRLAQGIMHTKEYQARMAQLQRRYDANAAR